MKCIMVFVDAICLFIVKDQVAIRRSGDLSPGEGVAILRLILARSASTARVNELNTLNVKQKNKLRGYHARKQRGVVIHLLPILKALRLFVNAILREIGPVYRLSREDRGAFTSGG